VESELELKTNLAHAHDERMRELEKQNISNWCEMAELAIIVRDNQEWELLNYKSWSDWLENAAPQSRSSVYGNIRLLGELELDISRDDLKQIPHATAKVLPMLDTKERRNPATVHKAKNLQPKKFVQDVQERRPDLHIEKLAPRKYSFTASQAKIIDGGVEMYRAIEGKPDATDEEALEGAIADYILQHRQYYEGIAKKRAVTV
jgi:hypothetical protein